MVTKNEFWNLLLTKTSLSDEVSELKEGECTTSQDLYLLAKQAGINKHLNAPTLISLDTLRSLPKALKQRRLYVVRLGQRLSGRARFILCKACPGYKNETISVESLDRVPELPVSIGSLPKWAMKLATSSKEATALLTVTHFVRTLSRSSEVFMLPSIRLGSVRFSFRPTKVSKTYTYWGQVEVDAALGDRQLFAVEAKYGRGPLFKHKIAFSTLALAKLTKTPVHPIVAFVVRRGNSVEVLVAHLSPPAEPIMHTGRYVVEEMRPTVKANLTLRLFT